MDAKRSQERSRGVVRMNIPLICGTYKLYRGLRSTLRSTRPPGACAALGERMVHTDRFKLAQLKLDQLNYRLGKTTTQRETLRAMIADQKNKLVNHAADIVRVGLSPGEFVWVTPDPKDVGMYTVLEGNRRIAALKILETPALADGTYEEKSFRALAREYKEPIREIEARVFVDREEAKPWIRRRHMSAGSGVGLQPWKPLAKGRAMRDEGENAPRSLAVVELLDDGTDAWAEIEANLEDRWTTVDRVLNSASFPKVLGVRIDPKSSTWPAPGSEDTELGVLMELEVGHGETEVHARVQA
jgi:hypothetical protein